MLLAAGRGERMEPLSSLIPKPALEVLGRPLLASALDHLAGAGCRRVVVNLHRHPELLAAAAREAAVSLPGVELAFSFEPELLGGAGGLAAARPMLGGGPVLVGNADVRAALDLAPLLAVEDEEAVVLGLLPHPDPGRWSSVLVDGDRVAAFVPAGAAVDSRPYLFTGFQRFGAAVVARLPRPPAEMGPVWEKLRARGRLRAAVLTGTWREAGTPDAYRRLVVDALDGASFVHAQAGATGARLERSAVGAGCRVADGARLVDSVLTAGATVADGCRLTRCVVAGCDIAPDTGLADALVMPTGVGSLGRGKPAGPVRKRTRA